MLGENPEEGQRDDPRSFPQQTVPRRMAIISAGVIMNVLFGFVLFLVLFKLGVPYTPTLIGTVEPGGPAWKAGIERGDKIEKVSGESVYDFEQVYQAVMLSDPKEANALEVSRGTKALQFQVFPQLNEDDYSPHIGVGPSSDLTLARKDFVAPGSAASRAEENAFQGGDRIVQIDGQKVETFPEFARILAQRAGEEVRVGVVRALEQGATPAAPVEMRVPQQYFRDLGLKFQMGKVTAVRAGSPAERAGATLR